MSAVRTAHLASPLLQQREHPCKRIPSRISKDHFLGCEAGHALGQFCRSQDPTAPPVPVAASLTCTERFEWSESPKSSLATMNRRSLLSGSSMVFALGVVSATPVSARGIDSYIKRRPPPPLEDCVPPALAARKQLLAAGDLAQRNDIEGARDLLRSGPFYRLRESIKGLAEYANNTTLSSNFLNALEEYDRLLANGFTKKDKATQEAQEASASALKQLQKTVSALDALLQTIPAESLAKAAKRLATPTPAAPEVDELSLQNMLSSLKKD